MDVRGKIFTELRGSGTGESVDAASLEVFKARLDGAGPWYFDLVADNTPPVAGGVE